MADARLKQLKIKTGVVKRLLKEKSSYEAEVTSLEKKLAELKAEGADAYKVKKAEEVLGESAAMVPDTVRRLGAAVPDLAALLQQCRDAADLPASEDYAAAEQVLAQANAVLA